MDERTADEAFRRYQATGEPEDLAWVFDRLAGRLLLVAAHLAPDGPTAEDLVQGTFLEAMRNAPAWDGERPLIGWMVGILRNLAAARHRRGARQRALPEEALVAPVPTDDFEQQEMLARVQAIIEDLPAPYREVLLLHLIQGLGPKAIAHSLDRAPGTVRMQIHRGLQRLRETLPAGTLPALFGLHLPSDRWPALRADLLQQAAAHQASIARSGAGVSHIPVPAPVPALTIGALLMGHKLLLSSILILAVALAVWNWKSATPGAGLAASGPMEVSLPANLQGDFPLRSADTSPSGRQVAAPDPSPSGPSTAEDRYSLDAKLVRAGDRMPLFGVQLAVLVPGSAAPIRRALTDEQGRVTWQELPAGTYRVRVDRGPSSSKCWCRRQARCILQIARGHAGAEHGGQCEGTTIGLADVESIAAAVVDRSDRRALRQGRFTLENAAHLLLLLGRPDSAGPRRSCSRRRSPPSFSGVVLGAPAGIAGPSAAARRAACSGCGDLDRVPLRRGTDAAETHHGDATVHSTWCPCVATGEGRFASDEIPRPAASCSPHPMRAGVGLAEVLVQGTGQVSLTLGPAGQLQLEVEGRGCCLDLQLRLLWMGSDTLGPFWPGAAAALRHRRPLRGAMAELDELLPGRATRPRWNAARTRPHPGRSAGTPAKSMYLRGRSLPIASSFACPSGSRCT
ncbi:MAG: sigma-70 family RNA polymerase sigma factor [Planctomycetota bacterium]